MKNIHLIPTDKPSRLYEFGEQIILTNYLTDTFRNQNIYITSEEEIKEGDWYYLPRTNSGHRCNESPKEVNLERSYGVAKIILTTDQDLINNGVQPIDDEFLEWFVKNPKCEWVEVKNIPNNNWGFDLEEPMNLGYKIITQKEEPKQETLEEIKDLNYWKNNAEEDYLKVPISVLRYISELEKQQERMYSEEDLRNAYRWGTSVNHGTKEHFNEWFEQFKKK